MYDAVEFRNLRGVEAGRVVGLAPLTLIVGPNNSGKSTLLEGLFLAGSQGDVSALHRLLMRRGWTGRSSVEGLFLSDEKTIYAALSAGTEKTESQYRIVEGWPHTMEDRIREAGLETPIWTLNAWNGAKNQVEMSIDRHGKHTSYRKQPNRGEVRLVDVETISKFGQLEDAYSRAIERGREPALEALVKALIGETARLRILKVGDNHVLHVIDTQGAVSVYHMGDGFKRLLYLAAVFATATDEMVLLEEPEAFQHPRFAKELARLIWQAVGQGAQVIMSTHSEDLLESLFAGEHDYEKVAVLKTRLEAGELKTIRIAGPRARDRVNELAEDLRR